MKQEHSNKSLHSIVFSDIHLTQFQEIDPKKPLWKKYKSTEFGCDQDLCQLLEQLLMKYPEDQFEIVLNGDVLDFDEVTKTPDKPVFKVSKTEKKIGLHPEEAKSLYKMEIILKDHLVFFNILKKYLDRGHSVVFIVGNHDIDLQFEAVQNLIWNHLVNEKTTGVLKFCEWFYISNGDTYIEHGHQYDPYCVSNSPLEPFIVKAQRRRIRLPFGNLATRYLVNIMGYFNPHTDESYRMTFVEYLNFFRKYMIKDQPFILFQWINGGVRIFFEALWDFITPGISLGMERVIKYKSVAEKSNVSPSVVPLLLELQTSSAISYPRTIMKELWIDRFLLIVLLFILWLSIGKIFQSIFGGAFYWSLISFCFFLPLFIFYAGTMKSYAQVAKEPQEDILQKIYHITQVKRVVFGHTHQAVHKMMGPVEHLNCGTWAPAFLDVDCQNSAFPKTFVWIQPSQEGPRTAGLFKWEKGQVLDF